jgi:hypothetical protein
MHFHPALKLDRDAPYFFMAWSLIKLRESFTCTLMNKCPAIEV